VKHPSTKPITGSATGSNESLANTRNAGRWGTRYEKLAVDYVALWMVAMIEKLLHLG
jgi:hypothetical protein